MACNRHEGVVTIFELPKVVPGVIFKKTPPAHAPIALVRLLNEAATVLNAAYLGKTGLKGAEPIVGAHISVTADWLGERKWQLEFSANNGLAHEGLPDGGMIESMKQFATAVARTNELLKVPGSQALMGEVLKTSFEPGSLVWSTKPGAAGEDGESHGVTVVLNCATNPNVGIDSETGRGYWEVK
jgi:hypothetical protein